MEKIKVVSMYIRSFQFFASVGKFSKKFHTKKLTPVLVNYLKGREDAVFEIVKMQQITTTEIKPKKVINIYTRFECSFTSAPPVSSVVGPFH